MQSFYKGIFDTRKKKINKKLGKALLQNFLVPA